MRTILVGVVLLSAGLSGAACGRAPQSPPAEATAPLVRPDVHAAYLKDNAAGHEWFANASDGYSGVPLVLLRSLPDLAPDIWGKADEQFARFGYLPNPDGPLPLGLSWDSMDAGVKPQPLHPGRADLRRLPHRPGQAGRRHVDDARRRSEYRVRRAVVAQGLRTDRRTSISARPPT